VRPLILDTLRLLRLYHRVHLNLHNPNHPTP
jgi:hypothetical protein